MRQVPYSIRKEHQGRKPPAEMTPANLDFAGGNHPFTAIMLCVVGLMQAFRTRLSRAIKPDL